MQEPYSSAGKRSRGVNEMYKYALSVELPKQPYQQVKTQSGQSVLKGELTQIVHPLSDSCATDDETHQFPKSAIAMR